MTKIPDFLAHLKIYGGYPVPFTQMWVEDKPDFRVIDPVRVAQCLNEKLCAICGKRLGEYCYFIGGPSSSDNHLFLDPPMHERCADFAAKTCPFLSGKKPEYSDRPVNENITKVEAMASDVRPEAMFILRTRTKKVRFVSVQGSEMIQAGPWLGQKQFSVAS